MNWKKWKLGLIVSALTAILSAAGAWALATEMNLKSTIALFVGFLAKDLLLYLTKHPVDSLSETTFITKVTDENKTTETKSSVTVTPNES